MGSAPSDRMPTSPHGRGGRRRPPRGAVQVVPLTPDDWRSYAELRTRMLAEAPEAFWTTLSDVEDLTEQEWRRRCDDRTLQARDTDGAPLGTVTVLGQETPPHVGLLPGAGDALVLAVYVIPEARGHGVVDALLDAARAVARDRLGAARLVLQVTETNVAARRVYDRHGYVLTGNSLPHPRQPGVRDLEMTRPV